MPDNEPLWKPSEVAALFGVSSKTVARWAKAGLITSVNTPGGHRRYRAEDVKALQEKAAAQG